VIAVRGRRGGVAVMLHAAGRTERTKKLSKIEVSP